MKIKITESQLRRVVEKVQESDNINEAWYDDVADFVKSSYSSLKGKTKEIFKKVTGVDYDEKDDIDKNETPSDSEIEKNIKKLKDKTGGNKKNIIIGDSTTPYVDNAVQKASRIDTNSGESSLWKGGMSVIWLIGALKKYPVDEDVENVIISMGTNGGFGKYLKYDVSELFTQLRKKFPNAKFIVVQGSWGMPSLKNIKPEDVKKYYKKYKDEGAIVIEPPIGDVEPHGDRPVYKKIAREIDSIL